MDDSDSFSEQKLKEARMANRLLQNEDSDARLEAMFGDAPEEEGDALPASIGEVRSWDAGAAEVAKMIGAEVGATALVDKRATCVWGAGAGNESILHSASRL